VTGALLGLVMLFAAPQPVARAQPIPMRPVLRWESGPASVAQPIIRGIGTRRGLGRTEVWVVGADLRSYRLSEPFRVHGRWRLYLTLDGAQLAMSVPRTPHAMGAVSRIRAEQRPTDVRVIVESGSLGQYGFRAGKDTLVLWMIASR
jgi:hypothetical protein